MRLQLSLGSQLIRNHCLPDGHFAQMVVAPPQYWPHWTALRSTLTCWLCHPYFRKSCVSSHSTCINTALWRFLLSPVPQLKQIHSLIKHHPSFFLVLTSSIYFSVSASLRIITSCSTYGEILLLQAPFWGTVVVLISLDFRHCIDPMCIHMKGKC